jgi:hypothetical protein
MGLPAVSNILNLTVDASGKAALPVPFKLMIAGVAETNCTEPALGGVTVKVLEDEFPAEMLAVTVSKLPQPLSRYEPIATPPIVVTLELSTALPLAAQGEVKLTLSGEVVPVIVTDTLVEP